MNRIDVEDYEEAILEITGHPKWGHIVRGLLSEIEFSQQNVFLKNSWDEVLEEKGFCKGLAYVMTLREQVVKKREEADADV